MSGPGQDVHQRIDVNRLHEVVVEASLGSGSLITARVAIDQGREVFAIPGSIHNPLAKGCHQLIRDGAKLVETAQEVIEELAPMVSEWRDTLRSAPLPQTTPARASSSGRVASDDAEYTLLRQALGYDPVSIDGLTERTRLTVPVLSSMLLRAMVLGEPTRMRAPIPAGSMPGGSCRSSCSVMSCMVG